MSAGGTSVMQGEPPTVSPLKAWPSEPQIADLRDDVSTASSLEEMPPPTPCPTNPPRSWRRPPSATFAPQAGGSFLLCNTFFCACAIMDDEDDCQRAYFRAKHHAKSIDLVPPPADVEELHHEIDRRGEPPSSDEIDRRAADHSASRALDQRERTQSAPLDPVYPPPPPGCEPIRAPVQPALATRVDAHSERRDGAVPVATVAEPAPRAIAAPAHVHAARNIVMRSRSQRAMTEPGRFSPSSWKSRR